MSEFITVKHSFNSGDLIVLLSGLKHLSIKTGKKILFYQYLNLPAFYYNEAVHPVKDNKGEMVCMNEVMWEMMKPLLQNQEYIEKAETWEGQEVEYDIDLTRDSKSIPMPAGLLHHYSWTIYPEMSCDLSEKWLNCYPLGEAETTKGKINLSDKIIINRTERYQNVYISYYFLKNFQHKIIFAGTEGEHEKFCSAWKLDIPQLIVKDFNELARVINSSAGFIGNQSFCWHLADAQKVPRILELCPQFPNTFPTGANGHAFYKQKSLEYYFDKLIS